MRAGGSGIPAIFLGDGKGHWKYWTEARWPHQIDYGSVVAADFNKDGHMDLAFAVHLVEVGIWALSLELCGEFSNFAAAYYHSAVNYTTLGDSAFAMTARWRLLAGLEAGNGMLMFGITTAAIFAVIQRLLQHRYGDPNATMR